MPQFGGLTFRLADLSGCHVFKLRPDARKTGTEIVSIDGHPTYLHVHRGRSSYFLLGCDRLLDIDAPAARGQLLIERFLNFVPFLSYLRRSFGDACWTNRTPAACLIIDDPLLRERYGFLEFDRLEARMAASPFSLNIAFIPWNFQRSVRTVAIRSASMAATTPTPSSASPMRTG
jgi:hypothetical protein